MIDPNEFKIRCSAIGEIMAGTVGLTDTQAKRMVELFDRKVKGEKPLTELMEKELADLQHRQKNPELPQSAKTFCLNWLKERLYHKRKAFSSKYTEKGITMEKAAIDFCSELLGWGMVDKNTERFSNEWMTGEPDLILAESVEDIKCSWDCFSFPLFHLEPLPAYEWQLHGYMHLTGRNKAGINYCLMDAPEVLIEHEARKLAWSIGEQDVTVELYDQVAAEMTYSHLPASLRHKRYELSYDPDLIEAVKDRVELCRIFIDQTLKTIT